MVEQTLKQDSEDGVRPFWVPTVTLARKEMAKYPS